VSYNGFLAVSDNTSVLLEFIKKNSLLSSKEIHDGAEMGVGYATVKRMLQQLVSGRIVNMVV
jgi:hypothetical protein